MNINYMQAGEELDALMAEKVMGWTLSNTGSWYDKGNYTGYMHYPPHPCYENCDNKYFKPSTNIAAAWEVVKKLQAIENHLSYYPKAEDEQKYTAKILRGRKYHLGHANTAPLAICRAVLKAVNAL